MNNTLLLFFNKNFLINILCTIILILPAIINGYPIVYSDTSTYIASGFQLEMPFDRPITYGLFIRIFSLNGLSLWLVIFFQTYILVFLINKLLKLLDIKFCSLRYLLLYIIFLFSGIGWTCSQVIADVFTPIVILSLLITLIDKSNKVYLYYFLFTLSSAMHLSHFGINILLITSLIIIKLFPKLKLNKLYTWRYITLLLCLTIVSFASMSTPYAKSKHAFLFGAFVEHGIIKEYLNEKCATSNYKICKYKDSLPDNAVAFIWDANSPFYKIGGFRETKAEFNEIIKGTLTSKKYLWLHFKAALKVTFKQLVSFNMGDGNGSFVGETLLNKRILLYFHREHIAYQNSHQNKNHTIYISLFNQIQNSIILLVSIFILLLLIFKFKLLDTTTITVLIIIFIFILIHSASCGILANCAERYGCRVIWLLPLLLFISFNKLVTSKIRLK